VAITAAAVLYLAPLASAVPEITGGVGENQVATSIPSFTITSTDALTVDVTLTGPGGTVLIHEVGVSVFPSPYVTQPFASAADGPYTLKVDQSLPFPGTVTRNFSVSTAVPAVNSGPVGIVGPASPFTFTWTLKPGVPSSRWQLYDFGTLLATGVVAAPAASVVVAPALPPGDRTLNFQVSWLEGGFPGLPGFWPPFIVDQTPPGAPVLPSGPVGTSRGLTPSFSWEATELGGTFEWDVTNAAGSSILPPGVVRVTPAMAVTTPALTLAANVVHRLIFHVRQVDPYGNRGPELTIPFTITTVPTTRLPTTRFAKFMTPAAGRVVRNLRPVLRWRRMNPGTSVFNVQVWLGGRKILSRFPKGTSLRIPPKLLKPGRQYVWHVWSWIGTKRQYSSRRMTSYFLTRR